MNWKLENPDLKYESESDNQKVIIDKPLTDGLNNSSTNIDDVEEIDTNTKYELKEEELEEEEVIEKVDTEESEISENFKTLLYLSDKGILNLDDDAEYEDSEEGLKQALQDHLKKEKESFESTLGEEEKDLLEFIRLGGTAKEYLESKDEIDYSDIDLDDEKSKFNLVIEHLQTLGYEYEEAVDATKAFNDAGTLDKQASIAQKKLIELSKKTFEQKLEALEKAKAAKVEEQIKQQEDYKKTILSTRSLKGFEIKETEANKLYEFITKPIDKKTGVTALQKTDNQENRLAYAWLLMNGFNLDKLKKQALTEASATIKKTLGSHRDNLVKPKVTNIQKEEKEKGSDKLKISWNYNKKQ